MKTWHPLLLLPLLAACAGPGPTSHRDAGPMAAEAVTLTRLEPQAMEAWLEGTRYVGDWTSTRCFTDACRGDFRSVLRIYRRHVRHGEAELAAADGTRLRCAWVSYRDHIRGACQAADGQSHRLEARDA